DVDGQPKARVSHALMHFGEALHRVDEHARLRLEGEPHLTLDGVITELPAAFDKPLHEFAGRRIIAAGPGPEADRVRMEFLSDVHGPPQEIEPPRALRRLTTKQCRLMFVPGIEQEARAR